jgi:DNA-binding response OmpR family regulator
MLNIIIVEDHVDLREELVNFLSRPDWDVRGVGSGALLDIALQEKQADILILDLNLPDEDGIQIAKRIRATSPNIGIVMLTARNAAYDRALGYGIGADVYLTKPAHVGELESVIHNLDKRLDKKPQSQMLCLNLQQCTIQKERHVPVALTQLETNFIHQLALANDRRVAMEDFPQTKQNVVVMVSRLRQKLQSIESSSLIRTIHGLGYQLSAPIEVIEEEGC